MNDLVYCERCGKEVGAQDRFCKACGAQQDSEIASTISTAQQRSTEQRKLLASQHPLVDSRANAPSALSLYQQALTADPLRVIAGGNGILSAGVFVLFLQYLSDSARKGIVLYQLFFAIGYAMASGGWWSWSLAMPARSWTNPTVARPFRILALAFAAIALGGLAESIQLFSDGAHGGYEVGFLILTIGPGVVAFGFWSWAVTAARSSIEE